MNDQQCYYVAIIPYADESNPARVMGPFYDLRRAQRVENGASINLNHDRYYVETFVDAETPDAWKVKARG